ncbi:MAG: hypothetical protein KTR22_05100 [Flavobacteriaceae bacterium]|nr:hypothetical protein [Flavobacteriaceae bacterium]
MKNLLVILLFGIFQIHTVVAQDALLLKYESPNGRTLMIEADANSVYAYVMKKRNEDIAFHGFLCSKTDPFNNHLDLQALQAAGGPPPLIEKFANEFSHVKNLQEKDIEVQWKDSQTAEVFIRGEKYLIMDLKRQLAYSKALKADGPYGKAMAK